MKEEYLVHYGILGMKWGVRRSRSQLAKLSGKARSKAEDWNAKADEASSPRKANRYRKNAEKKTREAEAYESKLAKRTKKKKVSVKEMSDEDLRKAVNRLQMERQYTQLSKENVSRGKSYAKKVLAAGTTVATVTTTGLTIHKNAGKIRDILTKK